MNLHHKISLLCALFLLSGPTFALKSDKDQPIDISADSLQINDEKNVSIYKGKVKLSQGSLSIEADELTLYFNDANEMQFMDMIGKPAQFKQQDEDLQWMTGTAQKIEYRDLESLLILNKNANFKSGKEHIKSEFIKINFDKDLINAGKSDKERVFIKILPRVKNAQ